MTLLTVAQEVCALVGVHRLQSVFADINNQRTQQEMLGVANTVAQSIATDQREWTLLRLQHVITGDGVTEAFDLPENYLRMLLNTNVWRSTSTLQPMTFYPDIDEWLQRRAANYSNAWGEWIIYGGQIHIWPIVSASETVRFAYLDKNCVNLKSGGVARAFMSDEDTFRLDERLLRLGMIWQWKAFKGSPYAEDMATFMDALTNAMGADKPAPILIQRLPISLSVRSSYPYPTPSSGDWSWPLS